MANPPLQSPTNPHFFQPLLPGSDTQLRIPDAFFSKHIEGKKRHKTAELRSDISDKIWQVKIDGQRLTTGWKDFTTAHDFRIGDIIVFKHQGNMVFHVTPFGPSCCEFQYSKSHIINDDEEEEEEEEDNEIPKSKTEAAESSSLSFDYCFVAKVTASNLKVDTINLPVEASSSKALNRRCQKMIVVNKEGKSWTLDLRFKESNNCYYIRGGWGRFCHDNKLKEGDLIPFNLVGDGNTTPMLCVCPEEECYELIK
ncbi:unnamed protein product [Cochlearia groenlandica]